MRNKIKNIEKIWNKILKNDVKMNKNLGKKFDKLFIIFEILYLFIFGLEFMSFRMSFESYPMREISFMFGNDSEIATQ
jgi:hypothetical protein